MQGRVAHLLGLSSPEEIASLPYVDDATGQRIALSSELQARCVSEIFSAAFQLADVAVTAQAANADCGYTRANPGLQAGVAGETLGNVGAMIQTLGADATGQTASIMGNLTQVVEQLNQTNAALTTADEAVYTPKRIAQVRCVRDIGWMMTSSLGAGAQLTQSLPNCAPSLRYKDFRRKSKCAQQVLLSVRVTSLLSANIAMLVDGCRPQFSKYRACASFLELLSWVIAGAARVYSNAVQVCSSLTGIKNVGSNVARCIGPVFSSMGYISAASVNFASGRNYWCSSAKTYLSTTVADPNSLTPAEDLQLTKYRAGCARDHLSGVRQLLFAGYRMITAAAGCTRTNYLCQMDIARAASAFVGTGQAIAQMVDFCYMPPEIVQDDTTKKKYMAACAGKTLALVKILGVTVSYATEATSSCIVPNYAKSRCAASVWRAIAGMGALGQEFTEMRLNCALNKAWFVCGKNQRWAGGSVRIFVLGFTGALLNCPLSPFREEWDATGHFNFPFWFSFP